MTDSFNKTEDGFLSPASIDETTDFESLYSAEPPLVLDFSSLKAINSYGIRKFIKFIRAWEPRPFSFVNCSPVFIDSVNVVMNLVGTSGDTGCIKSLFVPHIVDGCSQCDSKVRDMLLKVEEIDQENFALPEFRCSDCNEVMAPDVELDEFLIFLESKKT